MALETGTYISDLVATNPPGTDLKSQGDDHLRLIKSTVKTTFPNITGAVTPTHTELNYVDGVVEAIQTQIDRKAGKNLIINGDFQINQRAFSGTATNGDVTLDCWRYRNTTDAVHFVSGAAVGPTVAAAGRLTNIALKIDPTTADATIAAGQYVFVEHAIEGYDFMNIAQKIFTLSFWVFAPSTGIYCVSFRNSGLDRSYVAEYTVNAANTWEYKTITVTASPTAGTWDYTNGVGLVVGFTMACGSTFQTTAGSWQTGNYLATVNQVNGTDTIGGALFFALVKLESGSYDTAFDGRDIEEEMSRCQRRYWRGLPMPSGNFPAYAISAVASWAVKFPVTMRAAPTMASDFTGITLSNTGTPAISTSNVNGCKMTSTATAINVNCNFSFAAGNYIEAKADL